MNPIHAAPEIYRLDIPYNTKCDIVKQLCLVLAIYLGIPKQQLRAELVKKLHVDYEALSHNPVGLLLMYEYLYAQRPIACMEPYQSSVHRR